MSADERYVSDRQYAGTDATASIEDQNSEQIQRRIDRTRGAMDETLDALGERLNPRRLIDQAIDGLTGSNAKSGAKSAVNSAVNSAGHAASDFAASLGRQVRRNPAATILIGAGLAWMAFGDREEDDSIEYDVDGIPIAQRRSTADRYAVDAEGYGQSDSGTAGSHTMNPEAGYISANAEQDGSNGSSKVAQTASKAGEKASEFAKSAKSTMAGAAENAQHAIASAGQSVAQTASKGYSGTKHAADTAYRSAASGGRSLGRSSRQMYRSSSHAVADAYDQTAERFQQAHEDYPLALGFGFLALGALAGLAVPRTRPEDRWMGETSDEFKQQTWDAGEEALEKGKEVVGTAVETAKHSAKEHGLSGEELAARAKRVASEAAKSAKTTAKEQGLSADKVKQDVKQVAEDTKQAVTQEAKQSPTPAKPKPAGAGGDRTKSP